MNRNKLFIVLITMALLSSAVFLFGCPINEEKADPNLPPMTCERMVDYVYVICGYKFSEMDEGVEVFLTNDEATEKCQDWEGTADWEGCSWEWAVECADERRKKDDCESWKACRELWTPGDQDDDDTEE